MWYHRSASQYTVQLRISAILGLATLIVNTAQAGLLGTPSTGIALPQFGNLFIIVAALANGVLGSLAAIAAGILPYAFWTGDHLYSLRMICLSVALGISHRLYPRLSAIWVVLGLWALVVGPMLIHFSSVQAIPEIWTLGAVLSSALQDITIAAFAEVLLLDRVVRHFLKANPIQMEMENILKSMVILASAVSLWIACEFLGPAVPDEYSLSPAQRGNLLTLFSCVPFILFGLSLGSAVIARFLRHEGRAFFIGDSLPSTLARTFSGQASEYWRRLQNARTRSYNQVVSDVEIQTKATPPPQGAPAVTPPNEPKDNEGQDVALCAVGRDGTIAYVNSRFRELVEIRQHDVAGKDFRAIGLPQSIQDHLVKHLDQSLRDGPTKTELRLFRTPSQVTFLEFHSLLPADGPQEQSSAKSQSLIITVSDITSKRTLQPWQLAEHQRFALGALLQGTVLKFTNVLTSVCAYTSYAEHADSDTERSTALRALRQQTEEAGTLLRQLFVFSGQHGGMQRQVRLDTAVKDYLGILALAAGKSENISLGTCQEDSSIEGDIGLIQQALLTLVIHARDSYGNDGGPVEVSVQHETLDWEVTKLQPDAVPGEFIRLRVKSRGHGMTPEEVDRLLNPELMGQTGGYSITSTLSAVYSITKAHGGFLTAESHPERGSTISLYFPRSKACSAPIAEPMPVPSGTHSPLPRGRQEHILVVEENSPVRDALTSMLTFLGYRVGSCPCQAEALEICKRNPFDLILVDSPFPELQNFGGIREMRELQPQTKGILLTNSDISPPLASVGLLAKPFNMETLAHSVRATLDEKKDEGSPSQSFNAPPLA